MKLKMQWRCLKHKAKHLLFASRQWAKLQIMFVTLFIPLYKNIGRVANLLIIFLFPQIRKSWLHVPKESESTQAETGWRKK